MTRLTLSILLAIAAGPAWAQQTEFCAQVFRKLFHEVGSAGSVTTLRQELKVAVKADKAENFLKAITKIVGSDRIGLRDTPPSPDLSFVTETDYLPAFRGVDEASGQNTFGGVIRIRNYRVVPKDLVVDELEDGAAKFPLSRLADGDGNYAKLEFKIGHPEEGPDGILRELEGVVDKPGVVLDRADIDALLKSPASFQRSRKAVLRRGLELSQTRGGVVHKVNDESELNALVERIGEIHKHGEAGEWNAPLYKIRYKRTARRVSFSQPHPFEVQVTIDEDIWIKNARTGETTRYPADDRIIELKIPVEFAGLSDAELEGRGLGDLARLRRLYLDLPPAPGTVRNSGKRAQGARQLEN